MPKKTAKPDQEGLKSRFQADHSRIHLIRRFLKKQMDQREIIKFERHMHHDPHLRDEVALFNQVIHELWESQKGNSFE